MKPNEKTEQNWVVDKLLDLMGEMHEMGAEILGGRHDPDDKKGLLRLAEEMKAIDEALTKIRNLDR